MFLNKKKKLIVYEEINGEFIPVDNKKRNTSNLAKIVATSPVVAMLPRYAYANTDTDEATRKVYDTIMNIFDTGVVFIIIFAAGAWSLGHRNKAIHTLICVGIGYVLAKNAVNIRDFLKYNI